MENEKISLTDASIPEEERIFLAFLALERTVAEVAAKFNLSYSHTYQRLQILVAKKYVNVHKPMARGQSRYIVNYRVVSM